LALWSKALTCFLTFRLFKYVIIFKPSLAYL